MVDNLGPLQPNVGGVLAPEDLIGREIELEQLLRAVTASGARLLGDRRIGKTSLLGKLELILREAGHTVVRVSAETPDPQVFLRQLAESMRSNRAVASRWSSWEKQFGGELRLTIGSAGVVVSGSAKKSPAAELEADVMDLLVEATGDRGQYLTVVIVDEITVLTGVLNNKREGAGEDFLRTLRAPRQRLQTLSMVFAGSVGLHHVIRNFGVVSDLEVVELGSLRGDEAALLARRLLRGTGLSADMTLDQETKVTLAIVEETNGLPYYIQALVNDLSKRNRALQLTPTAVAAEVDDALLNDRWQHSQFDTRLDQYYEPPVAALARRMLDEYAVSDQPLSIDELARRLSLVDLDTRPKRDELLDLVRKLEADHYLVRSGNDDQFANDLLRRAWRYRRRL